MEARSRSASHRQSRIVAPLLAPSSVDASHLQIPPPVLPRRVAGRTYSGRGRRGSYGEGIGRGGDAVGVLCPCDDYIRRMMAEGEGKLHAKAEDRAIDQVQWQKGRGEKIANAAT